MLQGLSRPRYGATEVRLTGRKLGFLQEAILPEVGHVLKGVVLLVQIWRVPKMMIPKYGWFMMVYNGKSYWNGWFGGTFILGNPMWRRLGVATWDPIKDWDNALGWSYRMIHGVWWNSTVNWTWLSWFLPKNVVHKQGCSIYICWYIYIYAGWP